MNAATLDVLVARTLSWAWMLRQWMDIATVDVLVARALQTYNHFAKRSSMSASGKSRSALFFFAVGKFFLECILQNLQVKQSSDYEFEIEVINKNHG